MYYLQELYILWLINHSFKVLMQNIHIAQNHFFLVALKLHTNFALYGANMIITSFEYMLKF